MDLIELMLVLATVISVADSNTIRFKDETGQTKTVKLACINTPKETKQQYVSAAAKKLKQLLPPSTRVVIRSVNLDDKGQTLGEVYVDNRSVNLRLVEEGNAVVDQESLEFCNETKTQFLIAEANAKNKRLGLWQQFNQGR
ncbi:MULTISPECIES: thermonuclease family protein [unclassified Tolypothrix]|uniref:thermonuclease family protein n=1 Tax=unclassified Tolypothrix TaxID=2649714 RepID=UPI0005EAA605|nr:MULTISPECIES: thermonuclease family protein [unclassified Tolypothrix]BAY93343.1 putative nuclease [Microchaete diplosiphon NIES-3275]EKF00116.1 nuclease [Tolypothrix sp. PCC 7601]MBE9083945.1 thermonuclease family protein [Tolypothrix sp. LEGE 11397]UYD27196.1 thermonuclease family protein [Tolypothrix sp. PCC 7712]UYD36943.1 thermonuclease family protein [Tolypothrix sp. PCC 7601]